MIIAGFSAYSRVIDWARFAPLARAWARTSSSTWRTSRASSTGLYPNPVPHADVVTYPAQATARTAQRLILARPNNEDRKKINSLAFPGTQGGPLMHVIAAKAVALLEALQPDFKQYQRQVVANSRPVRARW